MNVGFVSKNGRGWLSKSWNENIIVVLTHPSKKFTNILLILLSLQHVQLEQPLPRSQSQVLQKRDGILLLTSIGWIEIWRFVTLCSVGGDRSVRGIPWYISR